ncbi:3948_t:CDS:2 [Cetraspora pellucida]|uniref:3948_t:CDS:1 n=1 Tax=Cetraspora pellucida TaxID=1433469 RepID=A0A9N9EQX3_9GLOM|nr:3948_t:CDS:2 [Cetraspora pellucida]
MTSNIKCPLFGCKAASNNTLPTGTVATETPQSQNVADNTNDTSTQPTATDGSRVAAATGTPECDDQSVLSDSEAVSSVNGKVCKYNTVPQSQVGTKN